MTIMSNAEAVEFIQFIENVLWLFVAWLSGVYLGYVIGFRNGGM